MVHEEKKLAWSIVLFALFVFLPVRSNAQDKELPTRADILRWLQSDGGTPPLFREGDLLNQADLDKVRPFVKEDCGRLIICCMGGRKIQPNQT